MKKLLAVAVILLFFGLSIVPSTTSDMTIEQSPISFGGKTLYVGGDGPDNYTKIQDAINDAEDGDTVFVYDDSSPYFESVVIQKAITLMGEDKNTTVIEKWGRGPDGIAIYSDNVTVTGFTIQGFQYGIAAGIHVYSRNNTSIMNNILTNNSWGVRLQKSYYNVISNNIIYENGADGIYQEHGGDFNIIFENHIYENGYCGISHGGDNHNYSYNVVTHNSYGGISSFGDFCNYYKNTISYNYGEGIELIAASNNIIKQNTIDGNEEGLVLIDESIDNDILENTISNNGWGIDFENPYDTDLENNTIKENNFLNNNRNKMDKNNILIGNSFIDDGIYIEPNCLVQNNTVNGKPLMYMVNESDEVTDDAGQIILINCNNITIINQDLSNTYNGILLYNSNNCILQNNLLSSNSGSGIILEKSDNNYISGNTIIENNENGIELFDSNDNDISKNNISEHNKEIGIIIASKGIVLGGGSNNNIISLNAINDNTKGVEIIGSKNNKIISNNFYDNRRSATFSQSYFNQWDSNYWDKSRILPKPIFGTFFLFFPLVKFDWHPAQEPYTIGGMV